MLKVELHAHTADDPYDRIPHSATELVDRVAALGYRALAITLHDRQIDLRPLASHAADRGVVLIPGIERTIQGRHVLLINFRRGATDVASFDDLARLKQHEPGLVIAPHPFFPARSCLRGLMNVHAALFDAVECNAMFTRWLDFNRAALDWAARRGVPVVGNGDIHRLHQLGTTYSLVESDPYPDAICEAIRGGRVRVEARPLSVLTAARTFAELAFDEWIPHTPR
jgi:predicted metal-dependent phosphoesterase TrpH